MSYDELGTSATVPPTLAGMLGGTVLAERYRVDGVLGEGGMALVFEGHHLGLDRPIAIKVLKPAFVAEPQVRARFEREARAVSRLEHAGIVQMYDVGTTELEPLLIPIAYLVMERLRGQELSDVLDGPMPAPQALAYLEQVLEAVAHAHSRGIVHRDLKPDNIFVCETEDGLRLKLVDFGIAKMVESGDAAPLTQMGMIFGTPPYMSPEQATGMPVDGRTDLYSAGIIFYEMLAGQLPFTADDMMEVLRLQVNAPPPPLPDLPPAVATVLGTLLAKKPEDRYPDARAALAAVRAAGEADLEAQQAQQAAEEAQQVAEEAQQVAQAAPPVSPTVPALTPEVGAPMEMVAPGPPARTWWPPSRPAVLAGAAGLIAVLVVAWWPSGDAEDAAAEETQETQTPAVAPKAEAEVAAPFGIAAISRASAEALEPVDAALAVGKRFHARGLLAELRTSFPDDPQVLWRSGLAEGDAKKPSQTRAAYLLQAVALDPDRLADPEARAVIVRELQRPTVPEPLLDLVLEHGEPIRTAWTKALLGRERAALPYAQRKRLVSALLVDPRSVGTWDPAQQRCLDLWQAEDTEAPCKTFGEGLATMKANPSATYRRTLDAVTVPEPGADESDDACATLDDRRAALLEEMEDAPGDAKYIPRDYADQAKAGGRGGGKKKGRRPFGRLRRAFGG